MAFAPIPLLPAIPDGMSPRDHLILLLHVASEVEHDLMVQYLYAAYSLGGPQAKEYEAEMLGWREQLLIVAKEEMGHLLTVQNVLLLIGGPLSFDRHRQPWRTGYHPFTFRLEPLSLKSLACYTYAEMPPRGESEKQDLRGLQKRLARHVGKRMHLGHLPDAPQVGLLYQTIINILSDKRSIVDSTFNAASYRYQATWDEFGRGYRPGSHLAYRGSESLPQTDRLKSRVIITPVATRTEAIAALEDIAYQGEGPERVTKLLGQNYGEELSHFARFSKMYERLEVLAKKKGFSPSRPLPVNPYAAQPNETPPHATAITCITSRKWAALFDFRYRMLLSLLTHVFSVPNDRAPSEGPHRAQILSRVFGEMFNMKAIAGILVRLPLGDPNEPERAGPPFQLPYTLEQPVTEVDFWRVHLDLFDASNKLVTELLTAAESLELTPPDGKRFLVLLDEADRDARTWIHKILAGTATGWGTRA